MNNAPQYDNIPSLEDEIVSVTVTLDDEGDAFGESREFGVNLEFDFDFDGNLTVIGIQLLTAVDKRMSDLRYDIWSGLRELGYKISEQAYYSLPE